MVLIDTFSLLHEPMISWWGEESRQYQETLNKPPETRFDSIISKGANRVNGDELLEKIDDLFYNGLGLEWTPVQCKVYKSVIDSVLPVIYGKEWTSVMARVMQKRQIDHFYNEIIVSMGRRNGKSWVVSGIAAVLFLLIPKFIISVFSLAKRQSGMFMDMVIEKIEMAFKRGTHVRESDYTEVSRNQEKLIYEHPSGAKQILGSYPGSTKVRAKAQAFDHPPKTVKSFEGLKNMTSLFQEARDNVRACRKHERDVVEQFDYETPVRFIVDIIPQHIRDASILGLTVLNIDLIRGSVFLNRRHVYDLLEAQNSEIRYRFWEHLEKAIEAEFKDFGIEKSVFDISISWKD